MNGVKDAVIEMVKRLPDGCTWEEVMQQIYVRQKIEAGLRDADDGRAVSQETVFKEFSDDTHQVD